MSIQVLEASRTPKTHDQNRTSPWYIIIKTISKENKERILKATRGKNKTICKGKSIKIATILSTETLKPRRAWSEIL
jgi:tRNA A37 threonylcarbamoyladenosine dehydratase